MTKRLADVVAAGLALALSLVPAGSVTEPLRGAALADDDGGGGRGDDADDGRDDDRDDGTDDDGEDGGRDRPGPAARDSDGPFAWLLGGRDHVAREIVGYGLSTADRNVLAAAGFRILSDEPLPGLGSRITRLAVPPAESAARALARAEALLPGDILDLNHLYGTEGAVCDNAACWPAQMIGLRGPPPDGCRRRPPVALIDGLPDTDHPALRGATIETRSFLGDGLVPAASGHGTAIAALIAGRIHDTRSARPLIPGTRLLAAGVFATVGGREVANAVAILGALDWAVAAGARVVVMSLAGPPNRPLEAAIAAAARRAALAAAAGNSGPRGPAAYPAAYPGVLAVAAVDEAGRPYRKGTRGDYVDVAAPGVNVLSAAPGGALQPWTGTSFAVPFAAAALSRAMLATGNDPAASLALVRSLALDLGPAGIDPVFGAGLLRMPADCG